MNRQNGSFSNSIYKAESRGLSGKAAQVFEELERRLIYGVYKFGASLPTVALINEFNVSRAPLTAALNQLQFEGYIEITPQVGSRVINPSEEQIQDYFVMFGLVEQQLARFAAARRNEGHIDALAMICDKVTAVSSKLEKPNEEYIDIVDMYHMTIRQAAQSPYEVRRVSGYFRFAAFFLMNGWPKDFGHVRDSSNVNRPRVTKAIIEGDVEQAGMAMGQYILAGAFPS